MQYSTDEVSAALAAMQKWLLSPKVQIAEGVHSGGVAGWLNERDRPEFLYPEATGYYLTWLAFLAEMSGDRGPAAARANEALSWLSRQLSSSLPATRVYLEDSRDWRNSGAFAFDLAMLARGAALSRGLANEPGREKVLSRVFELLLGFCSGDEEIRAFIPNDSFRGHDDPARWSCNRGPYQAKIAAAVLSASAVSPAPRALHTTAEAVYRDWRNYSGARVLEGDHPTFYHLEGLSLAAANGWDPDAWRTAREAYLRVVGLRAPCAPLAVYFDGAAFENRADVLAQALRMGCLLRCATGPDSPELDDKLQHLAATLRSFIAEDGGVRFSLKEPWRHKNVWASMFAHQALSFYDRVAAGQGLPDRWLQLLV